MHLALYLGEYPITTQALFLETNFKSGNPPNENQRFKYQKNRAEK